MALYTCPICNNDNLLADEVLFSRFKVRYCKSCCNKIAKERRLEDPIKARLASRKWKTNNIDKMRDQYLNKKYNITVNQYNVMLALHNNGCAICKQKCTSGKQLSVDHNHITNEVRGLLCTRCNLLVSNCSGDENIIWNLLEYLKKYNLKISA